MPKKVFFRRKHIVVNALFTGVFTVWSSAVFAQSSELAVVRSAQTGTDGHFTLALISTDAGKQDLAALTSLCKQIRIFGRVEPSSSAATGHAAAMQALKLAGSTQNAARFQFGNNAGLKVANKTVPCALRSHGLSVERDVFRFATKASMAEKPTAPAKPLRTK